MALSSVTSNPHLKLLSSKFLSRSSHLLSIHLQRRYSTPILTRKALTFILCDFLYTHLFFG
ncbi:hypothetical protein Lalb_Chr25g0284361 [Lupinus albus]|uniref:Uncharacterized protein n=1 Tax=Lupinus albus TaxID=3870 RepID=A0A6A4NCJ1_LUPAL|nr:hypothetical protein Lalb_Chr25g0284361 [Lupinus albus]